MELLNCLLNSTATNAADDANIYFVSQSKKVLFCIWDIAKIDNSCLASMWCEGQYPMNNVHDNSSLKLCKFSWIFTMFYFFYQNWCKKIFCEKWWNQATSHSIIFENKEKLLLMRLKIRHGLIGRKWLGEFIALTVAATDFF